MNNSNWPKGEESFSVEPSMLNGPSLSILILMAAALFVMLIVWWRSGRREK